MTPELVLLAQRAVACPKWRWMRGMTVIVEDTISSSDAEQARELITWADPGGMGYYRHRNTTSRDLPDLTDLATFGCLLVLVREAWNDNTITTQFHPSVGTPDRKRWRVWQSGNPIAYGTSELEALVSALEQSLLHSK